MSSVTDQLTRERLRATIELLESIAADRSVLAGVPDEERKRLLQAVANVYSPDRVERRRMSKIVDRQRNFFEHGELAMRRLQAPLAAIGGRGVLVVHDEYLAEVPVDRAERGQQLVEQIMIAAMRELVDSVPIVVEAEIAEHWK